MGWIAWGVTADGGRVPLTVIAVPGLAGLAVPAVELDGGTYERVELYPGPPEQEHDRWLTPDDRERYQPPVCPRCGAVVRVSWTAVTINGDGPMYTPDIMRCPNNCPADG